MDYKEALAYIDGVAWFGSKPGLSRVTELLHALGDPQDRLKFVHIAGTNGKGSCAAMLSSVMKCCGYRTGLFTSPYLARFNERMQVNGKPIGDEALAEVVALVKQQHDKAVRILTENRQKLTELSEYLYEKETITGEEFMQILNA